MACRTPSGTYAMPFAYRHPNMVNSPLTGAWRPGGGGAAGVARAQDSKHTTWAHTPRQHIGAGRCEESSEACAALSVPEPVPESVPESAARA